jgi:4-hydroxyphenylacetate 3-monooxygenase oxygenase component
MPIRTGQQYVTGLLDGREVWIDGKRVSEVPWHPAFRNAVQTVAGLYDMQVDPELADTLTYESPTTHDRVATSFIHPRSVDDVLKRGHAFRLVAERTGGLMGRSPDFMNTHLAGMALAPGFFAANDPRFGDNIRRYYEHVRERDLCLTHVLIDPYGDRSKGPAEQDDPDWYLRIVEETKDGMIVRGAMVLATLGPLADELLVYRVRPLTEKDRDYSMAFAIPVATPGLKLLCRESFDRGQRKIDSPLSSRFDEMDASLLFQDVLVPWDRVFLKKDPLHGNRMRAETGMLPHVFHQTTTRATVKAQLVLGVASLMTEYLGTNVVPSVQEKLGELLDYVELLKACVRSGEADAHATADGTFAPALDPILAARDSFLWMYPRMIEVLQQLGSAALIPVVSEDDLHGPLSELVQRYFRGTGVGARDKLAVFRLAWELAVDSFGSRQVLYERFYSGTASMLLSQRYQSYDRQHAIEIARGLLK